MIGAPYILAAIHDGSCAWWATDNRGDIRLSETEEAARREA